MLALVVPRIIQVYLGDIVTHDCELNFYDGKVGPNQSAFISKARQIAKDYDVNILYLQTHGYDEVHVLPLFHILPGQLTEVQVGPGGIFNGILSKIGKPKHTRLNIPEEYIHYLKFLKLGEHALTFHDSGPRNIVLGTQLGIYTGYWEERMMSMTHGVDEDQMWEAFAQQAKVDEAALFQTMVFSNYLQTYGYCHHPMPLKPGLPTILYLATYGPPRLRGMFVSEPWKTWSSMNKAVVIDGLNQLAKTHNVIIRPHPMDLGTGTLRGGFKQYFPDCILDDFAEARHLESTVKLADVIVGEMSGVTSAAVNIAPDTPLVFLLRDWERYQCPEVKNETLNESMAEVFFPHMAKTPSDFLEAIARAKANDGPSQKKARRDYARRMFGDIDGFEEYRAVVKILRTVTYNDSNMAKDVDGLQEILTRFSTSTATAESAGTKVPFCTSECCEATVPWYAELETSFYTFVYYFMPNYRYLY